VITLSKSYWHVLFKVGVHGMRCYWLLLYTTLLIKPYRCRAPSKNLDDVFYQQQRTKEITEALIMTQDVPTLWSEHGIISDVVVRP